MNAGDPHPARDLCPALDLSPACGPWTGVGRYVRDLARGLHEAGAQAVGVYQGHHGEPDPALSEWVPRQARYDLLGGRPGLRWRLPPALGKLGANLYHATSTIGVPGAKWKGPVVATVHDCYPLSPGAEVSARSRRLFASILGQLCARARLFICPSRCSAEELRGHGWTGDIRIIHHGLAPVTVLPRPAAAPAEPYLLTLGAIEERKNLGIVAAAIALLGADAPPWFHIGPVRRDPGGRLQRAMADAGCTLLGYQSDHDRLAWLANAWALAQPSRAEGFGYPPLEAMQLGVPVLARPARALLEILGDAARWVAGDAPATWSDALRELRRDDRLRERLAEIGRKRARQFPLARMAEEHLEAYHEALG